MPEVTETHLSAADQKFDRQLLLSLMLSPLAVGISTIVGFTVAHWVTIIAYKRTGYLVAVSCFTLCLVAAMLAWTGRRGLSNPNETYPSQGRRLFMAKLALLLSAFCALVVLAGMLVLVTLGPSD